MQPPRGPRGKPNSPSWLAFLLQSTDSMFPTGAYAHSFGLEGAVQDDVVSDKDAYSDYLRDWVLPQAIHMELPVAGFAFDAARAKDIDRLCALDQEYGAMKATMESRTASAKIGAQRLSLVSDLFPEPFLAEVDRAKNSGHLVGHEVVILGLHCACSSMSRYHTLTAVYYLILSVLTNAIVKLIRIGQTSCQRILARYLKQTDLVIERALEVSEDEFGWFTPFTDIASARHETAYSRLFIS